MTIQGQLASAEQLGGEWMNRVRALLDQVAGWAQRQGWKAELAGPGHRAPRLHVHPPGGEITLEPVGGRVDVEAYPTLNRVKLVSDAAGGWQVITDSNIPLRETWGEETFARLAHDLLA